MNTLEAMKNTGETETVLFHGKGSLAPPRRALLLLLSHTRHVHFLRATCGQLAGSRLFIQSVFSRKHCCPGVPPGSCCWRGEGSVNRGLGCPTESQQTCDSLAGDTPGT